MLVPVPAHGMGDVPRALEMMLDHDGWKVAPAVVDNRNDPVEQLFSSLDLDDGGRRRTTSLLRELLEPGLVVIVRKVGPGSWPEWKLFLTEYELASRSVGEAERPLFLVFTEGVRLSAMPERAVALRVLACDNVLGELDTLLFVTSLLRKSGRADYKMRLVARMICRLALWDLSVAQFLVGRNPEELFSPEQVLTEALRALGMPPGLQRTWESGGLQTFDDISCAHPFLVVSEGDARRELTMRLWAAQATEVLPALELQRRVLIHRMRGLVPVPIVVDGTRYDDLDRMEIGPLSHVAHTCSLGRGIRHTAEKLKRLRNSLAHLEALNATDVFDEELYRHSPATR